PSILSQAYFDIDLLEELALDPRAYDFDHPANRRPNYHFGQWDPHQIDNRGFYRRFVLQQVTLDALLARFGEISDTRQHPDGSITAQEYAFEAGAVLAGTILMASGTSGNGPGCHDSTVMLQSLLPRIAIYRDRFYNELLKQVPGPHGRRLRIEADKLQQPFGGARQHLNRELARRRAAQLQQVQLAICCARMGYPKAASSRADSVSMPSARIVTKLHCLLTTAHAEIDHGQIEKVPGHLAQMEDLLHRGIACGALVDPWNIVGFGGNFSLFPAVENSIHDFRVDKLIDLVEQVLGLCTRAWSEAAARDDAALEIAFSEPLARMASWWDQFATSTVQGVKRLVGKEVEISGNLVAGALNSWHKAGAAAGDIGFWRMFIDQFDTPKVFQLVIDALLEKKDCIASMALMMQWISQANRTPLKASDSSFHRLAIRWLELATQQGNVHPPGNRPANQEVPATTGTWWPLVRRFFELLEANAENYWEPPTAFLNKPHRSHRMENHRQAAEDSEDEEEDQEESSLYSAAYEGVIFRGSTEDGIESDMLSEGDSTEFELEHEARQLQQQLKFLETVALLWNRVVVRAVSDGLNPSTYCESFGQWRQQAMGNYYRLLKLLESVHHYPLRALLPVPSALVEYDRWRIIKDTLTEEIVATTAEMAHSARLLAAVTERCVDQNLEKPTDSIANACSTCVTSSDFHPDLACTTAADPSMATEPLAVLRGLLAGDAESVRRDWPDLAKWLSEQGLLYVPLSRGGDPVQIVVVKARQRLIRSLLEWMPRLGLIRPTCELIQVAHDMELDHPIGHGAVTEFDQLFEVGYMAMVQCLVVSSPHWNPPFVFEDTLEGHDSLLVDALQRLAESQLGVWLDHSRTLRLSVVEKVAEPEAWDRFVAFVDRYGNDLFTQGFLNLGNIRGILHQGADKWFDSVTNTSYEAASCRLIVELGDKISRREAVRWFTFSLEAIAENYREYRDYNATTTQSDHGELLHTLIDFLRLRADYDRIAWNLRPVVLAHEVLARYGRTAAAEEWRRALTSRTMQVADDFIRRHTRLCAQHSMQLPTIASRISERFARPLDIGRVCGLVQPAIHASQQGEANPTFALFEHEINQITQEPSDAGLELPDWLEALDEEIDRIQATIDGKDSTRDIPPAIEQMRISWDQFDQELNEMDGKEQINASL
ncbi:MAG: hypothetical protein JW829_15240, partial [Pirellulales bacterium]|nr:hypothetical protein [Pirellulales bacterium]